jgi:hypothetical protein
MVLSWSPRTIALHHRDPAEADRRWRGEELRAAKPRLFMTNTDPLLAGEVERNVSRHVALIIFGAYEGLRFRVG